MFHLLGYYSSLAAAAADSDISALSDSEFSRRNNHFIFTEPYKILAIAYLAAGATRARFNVPSFNGVARMQIWPVERSVTITDDPMIQNFMDYPLDVPVNEEIAIEGSNDAGAGDPTTALLWVAPPGFNRNLPRGVQRLTVRFTGAVAGVANTWSADGAITFAENLKGGMYAVVGCQVFDAGVQAFRLNFPNSTIVNGRKLRPGGLATEAIGNRPLDLFMGGMGEWGRFHSFEPPQLQILANATGASTQEGRLDLVYLGDRS